jgi:TM2 domain-containing membrane protein YozV/RNA polymerase subunit RPABC4/transcription elongation factor Spt4
MFCRNCGNTLGENAAVCVNCGVAAGGGNKFCRNCSSPVDPAAAVCLKCGVALSSAGAQSSLGGNPKSKIVAGLLGIFLGGLGIHRFYLGYTTIGIVQLLITVCSWPLMLFCGIGFFSLAGVGIWGLVEGILILVGNINKDAQGRPLAD